MAAEEDGVGAGAEALGAAESRPEADGAGSLDPEALGASALVRGVGVSTAEGAGLVVTWGASLAGGCGDVCPIESGGGASVRDWQDRASSDAMATVRRRVIR
jgi:hypothetical protein